MILVDTSVWVQHLNGRATVLPAALGEQLVLTHPFVIGEISCGTFPTRGEVLRWISELPKATIVAETEVRELIERRQLMGRGIGYIDAHLVASALVTKGAQLLTFDKRLATVAAELNVGYRV